jgi:hypothetical protein
VFGLRRNGAASIQSRDMQSDSNQKKISKQQLNGYYGGETGILVFFP